MVTSQLRGKSEARQKKVVGTIKQQRVLRRVIPRSLLLFVIIILGS
jgi:hypothetical protein